MLQVFDRPLPKSTFEVISFRKYNEKKLQKPSILKGISKFTTIPYIKGKCSFQVFRKDSDIYVKFTDYFSPSMVTDNGMPLEAKVKKYLGKERNTKFVYGDSWGAVVLRQEAWAVFKNLTIDIRDCSMLVIYRHLNDLIEKYHGFTEYELECTNMSRFLENMADHCKEYGSNHV